MAKGKMSSQELLQLVRDARHRIANDAPGGIGQRPFDHPIYGPLLRRLDDADAHLASQPENPYERAVIEQAMVTECVSVDGRDPSDVIRDIISWHVSLDRASKPKAATDAQVTIPARHVAVLRQYLQHLQSASPTQSTRPSWAELKQALRAAVDALTHPAPSQAVGAVDAKAEQAVGDGVVAHRYFDPDVPGSYTEWKDGQPKLSDAQLTARGYGVERAYGTPRPAVATAGDGVVSIDIRDYPTELLRKELYAFNSACDEWKRDGKSLDRDLASYIWHCATGWAMNFLPTPRPAVATPLELRICELRHTTLQRDRPYIFTVDPNCERCREVAQFGHNYKAVATAGDGVMPRFKAIGHAASDEVHRAANLLEKLPGRYANEATTIRTAVAYLREYGNALASPSAPDDVLHAARRVVSFRDVAGYDAKAMPEGMSKAVEALHAALGSRGYASPSAPRVGVPEGWLPIETAPNDGTMHVRGLHVFSPDGAFLYWDALTGYVDSEDGAFYDMGGDDLAGWGADDFTHWHPLAAAPDSGGV